MSRRVYPKILDDGFIERSLTDKAGEIEPRPLLESRVCQVLRTDVAHRRPLLAWIPGRKRIAVAAACLVLAGSGFVMAFSPGLAAQAATRVEQLINHMQVDISRRPGSLGMSFSSKAPANGQTVDYGISGRGETLAQAEQTVGFHIQVPSYLPVGYHVPAMVYEGRISKVVGQTGKPVATGKYEVHMAFDREQNDLPGLSLDISQMIVPHPYSAGKGWISSAPHMGWNIVRRYAG